MRRPLRTDGRSRSVVLLAVGILLGAALLVGCSGGSADEAGPTTTTTPPPPVTYVNLGSTDARGGGADGPARAEAWPRLFTVNALPGRTVYLELAAQGATVNQALETQLPAAVAAAPTVATVWFGAADAFLGTSPDAFEADLASMVASLEETGARVLVVLGAPPVDGSLDTAPYTDRAAAVADAAGVDVVDLTDIPSTTVNQPEVAAAVAVAVGPVD